MGNLLKLLPFDVRQNQQNDVVFWKLLIVGNYTAKI